jgi:Arf-GAP/coiled-coil/ANK repeat/PH domain-containing protein
MLDYVFQISMLQSKKKHEVLEALLNFVQTYGSFFRQGVELFSDVEPFAESLVSDIAQMKSKTATLERQLERRHSRVAEGDSDLSARARPDVPIEGYLFKRGQNAFRTWNRRWFYLQVGSIEIMYLVL